MLHFEWLWMLCLLPLPLLARVLLPEAAVQKEAALRVPFIEDFASDAAISKARVRSWSLYLALLAWSLFVLALMRPQWLGEMIEIPISGRDLMLAVDLSASMEEQDFEIKGKRVDRLSATKWVAGDFIERRVGDRIGLILFGEQAYLQTPLTFDRETVKILLYESVTRLAGQATAIGDAIGLAVKRLREQENDTDKILILLTDGANTAGAVEPLEAADLAAREDLKIYTIGVGADEMLVRSLFGRRKVNPSLDLDEGTLKAIAEKTGGQYFRARNTEDLNKIYDILDELEPIEQDVKKFRPRKSLYYWPLSLAMLLAGLIFVLRLTGRLR